MRVRAVQEGAGSGRAVKDGDVGARTTVGEREPGDPRTARGPGDGCGPGDGRGPQSTDSSDGPPRRDDACGASARWIPFPAAEVLALPPDLQAGWPDAQRPEAVSCALSARPRTAQVQPASGPLAGWVARAAVVLGGAPVVGGLELLGPGLRIVVSMGVLHRACCVVWRWTGAHPGASHLGDGCLLGRVDRAARLPALVSGLVPHGSPAAVLGVLGVRGEAPAPWSLGRPAVPSEAGHGGEAGPAPRAAAVAPGADPLVAAVRDRVRAELHRAVLAAAGETAGGTNGTPAEGSLAGPGAGGAPPGDRHGEVRR